MKRGLRVNKAIVTNIQRYSVHDGPGIRTTVFFKGCPLKCMWCHNPETQNFKIGMMYDSDKCSKCGTCQKNCPERAIIVQNETIFTDMNKCRLCGRCVDFCINCAREIVGKEYSIQELIKEIEKDRIFYEQSGGGVTLSGGEPMVNIDFIEKLINICDEKGISVVVDTCGNVPYENFLRIKDKVQMFLYDLKLANSVSHRKYTGVDNDIIIDNLRRLSKDGARINIRIPLIEGVNTDEENIRETIDIIKGLNIHNVNLLPYHDIAKDKYRKLDMTYKNELMKVPSDDKIQWIKGEFEKNNFNIKIGG